MSIPSTKNTIPICYRSDKKYLYFLVNSIKSVLKSYKGNKSLFFYICTTDLEDCIQEIDNLKQQYNFSYYIVKINKELMQQIPVLCKDYIKLPNIEYYIEHVTKKTFVDFKQEFHYRQSSDYNDNTYTYNPFGRSKFVTSCWILFLPFLINYYDKVILLDTDTIVIESIDNLYNIDVSTVCAGFCHDWATPGTLSPTNGLVNLHNMGKDFFTPDGLFEKFANLIINSDKNKFVFSEAVQKLMHEMFYNRCLILDKSWNVPITHRHLYDIAKIFHFSESWAGKKEVLSAYEKLVNKYLCDNKINL